MSRPGESHPEPLSEPVHDTLASYGSHQANVLTLCRTGSFIRLPVAPLRNILTQSLCSSSITEPSSLLRTDPPRCRASVLSALRLFPAWPSPLASRRPVPAVPPKSLCQIHAPSTPVAVRPIIRFSADLSQRFASPLVLTTGTGGVIRALPGCYLI